MIQVVHRCLSEISDHHDGVLVWVRFFDRLRRLVVSIERNGSKHLVKSIATAVDQFKLGQVPRSVGLGIDPMACA